MKCERCNKDPDVKMGLHDYCAKCGKNLCALCMFAGRCHDSDDGKHVAANHGDG